MVDYVSWITAQVPAVWYNFQWMRPSFKVIVAWFNQNACNGWLCELDDCTGFSSLITLRRWVKVKAIQTGIKMESLVMPIS